MKKQWDYVGNFTYGDEVVMMNNPKYARYVCPHTKEVMDIKIKEGEK